MSADYIPTREVAFSKYLKLPTFTEDVNEDTEPTRKCIQFLDSEKKPHFVWVTLNKRNQVIDMTRYGSNTEEIFIEATEDAFEMKWAYVG